MNRIKLFESEVKRMEEEIMRQNMKNFYCEQKLKEMERIFVFLYIREQKERLSQVENHREIVRERIKHKRQIGRAHV